MEEKSAIAIGHRSLTPWDYLLFWLFAALCAVGKVMVDFLKQMRTEIAGEA
jgi:hypothetical protein